MLYKSSIKLICLWMLVFLVGCAQPVVVSSTQNADAAPTTEVVADAADTLRIVEPFLNAPLDPAQGIKFYMIPWGTGEALMQLDPQFQPQPWLAEALTMRSETAWEITLRPGVTFHDGSPMDAAAVKASLERANDISETARQYLDLKSIDVIDDLTLLLTTNAPNLRMPTILADGTLTILNATIANEQGLEAFGLKPIGTGPYKVDELRGEQLFLSRYDGYWGPTPQFARIVVSRLVDAEARLLALQSGDVDIATNLRPESVQVLESDPNLKLVRAESIATMFIHINHTKEMWQDRKLRQALAYAIPGRETFVRSVLREQALPAERLFPPSILICEDEQTLPADPEQAQALLAEAGYVDSDGDGIVEKEGQSLTIVALSYPQQATLTPMAEIIQSSLAAVGIQMEIRSVESINDAIAQPDWDLAMYFQNMVGAGEPYSSLVANFSSDGASNRVHYQNSEVDEMLVQLRDTADSEGRRALACDISQTLVEDVAVIPLIHPFYLYGASTDITGFDVAHPWWLYFVTPEMGKQ